MGVFLDPSIKKLFRDMGQLFLSGRYVPSNIDEIHREIETMTVLNEAQALKSDWTKVGQDMRNAVTTLTVPHNTLK